MVVRFVDMAGSERIPQVDATSAVLEEVRLISQSLSSFGNLILCLTSQSKHIPWRDSKFGVLLRGMLKSNFCFFFIATLFPADQHAEESMAVSICTSLLCTG